MVAAGGSSVPAWVRAAVRFRRVRPPVGHSIRAGLCVGVPVALGFAVDEVVLGVTIGLACVLRTIGEQEGPHRLNVRNLLVATPIAACGYLFGAMQGWPLAPLVVVMAATAFVAGTLSVHGPGFALGGMQFLLVASVALGIPDSGVAPEIGWFLLGASIYAAAMAIDFFVLEPRRPDRIALAGLDDAIRALEVQPAPRQRAGANVALAAARRVPSPGWEASEPGIARWGAYADVVAAADDVAAWEGARQGPDPDRRAAYERAREAWAAGRPSRREPMRGAPVAAREPWRQRIAIDAATRNHALRLALCFGLAVSSRAWVDLDHWYWVPATVGLVMQPDFGSVFGRAVLRVAGTIVGSVIAALVLWAVPDGVGLGLVIGLLAATIPWAKQTSYILQSVALGAVVLLLVSQIAPVDGTLGLPVQRVLATIVGGVIVLVFGYLIWPGARRVSIAPTVAEATASIAAMLRTASTPVPADAAAREQRKATAVGARQHAFDVLAAARVPLARAEGEPPPASTDAAAWTDAVRSVEGLGAAVSDHAIARLSGTSALPESSDLAHSVEALATIDDPVTVDEAAAALADRVRNPGSA